MYIYIDISLNEFNIHVRRCVLLDTSLDSARLLISSDLVRIIYYRASILSMSYDQILYKYESSYSVIPVQ